MSATPNKETAEVKISITHELNSFRQNKELGSNQRHEVERSTPARSYGLL
jgi:hypothetical protein